MWATAQAEDRKLLGPGWVDTGKVFTDERGRPLSPSGMTWAWKVALRESGVRQIRPHDLRHTFAANLIAAGANVLEVQQLLGHSDPTVTLRVYGHLFPGADRAAVARAAALLDAEA